jgi:hypothetical protein
MHDFGRLVYLDLQKTGSTFVSRFLNETCALPLVKESKHTRIQSRPDRAAFYFITVRNPVSQYSSLFRYGLDRRGALYKNFEKYGKAHLYSRAPGSFNEWLRFILEQENAAVLGEGFERIPRSYNLGFLSYRYLMLSLSRPEKTILKKPRDVDLLQYARDESIVNHVIFNEKLNDGLKELATNLKPEFFDQERVAAFFRNEERVNASITQAHEVGAIADDVREMIMSKERVLLSFYAK